MKHLFIKGITFLVLLFSTPIIFVGCSNDDNNNDTPSVTNPNPTPESKGAIGTYVGTLTVWTYKTDYFDDQQEYLNAVMIVTDEGDNKVKLAPKSGEAYSHVAPRILDVSESAIDSNVINLLSSKGSAMAAF